MGNLQGLGAREFTQIRFMDPPAIPLWQRVGLDFFDAQLAWVKEPPKSDTPDDMHLELSLYGYRRKARYSDNSDRHLDQLFADQLMMKMIMECAERGDFSDLESVGIGYFDESGKPHSFSALGDRARRELAADFKQRLYEQGQSKRGKSQTPGMLCMWILAIVKQANRDKALTDEIYQFFRLGGVFDLWFEERYGFDYSKLPFHFPTKVTLESSRRTNFKSRLQQNAERALEAQCKARNKVRDTEVINAQKEIVEQLRQELFGLPQVFWFIEPSESQRGPSVKPARDLMQLSDFNVTGSNELIEILGP